MENIKVLKGIIPAWKRIAKEAKDEGEEVTATRLTGIVQGLELAVLIMSFNKKDN